jgi:hypothetical protein
MPTLDETHNVERLRRQIERLEAGEELIVRDIKALLSPSGKSYVDLEWKRQKILRLSLSKAEASEKKSLGWMSKRQVYLQALKDELKTARLSLHSVWQNKLQKIQARQIRIYFEAMKEAEHAGKSKQSAAAFANNELTRAGLRRMDGMISRHRNKRDAEIYAMEKALLKSLTVEVPRQDSTSPNADFESSSQDNISTKASKD